MPDAAKNSGSVLDSGEGDIVGGIKLGTHTGRLCDPDGTISASASCRVHQKMMGYHPFTIFSRHQNIPMVLGGVEWYPLCKPLHDQG